jgi:HNH endonuclease
MSRYISEYLRQFVHERANFRCEYCRISVVNSFYAFHIEHIISLKHGGKTEAENLALACQICNWNKGSDLGTYLDDPSVLIRFFNPRIDNWLQHFEVESSGLIVPKTHIAQATVKIFDLNHVESIIERAEMIKRNIF